MAKKQEHPAQLNFLDLLEVKQAAFEGPLSLLLELIRKQQVEVHQIQLSLICAPYLEFLGVMDQFDLEIAVDFLDLASTLVLIKSRALLPILEPPTPEEEIQDPEEELRARLVKYQQAQRFAWLMNQLPQLGRDQFPRPEPELTEKNDTGPLEDLSLFRLLESYVQVKQKQTYKKPHLVLDDEESLQDKINQLLTLLKPGEHRRFSSLLSADHPKPEVVVSFLAVLELTKFGGLELTQSRPFAELHLYVKTNFVRLKKQYLDLEVG